MALLLEAPPAETLQTFERAVAALGDHPEQDPNDRFYGHLPPLRMAVLTRQAAVEGNIDSARHVGWQYLVKDSRGLAVVDISDSYRETYTSVRRGKFADAYEAALHLIDSESAENTADFTPQVLEVPQLWSCALVARGPQQISIYPLVLSGKLANAAAITPDDFFRAITPHKHSNDRNGPVI